MQILKKVLILVNLIWLLTIKIKLMINIQIDRSAVAGIVSKGKWD